MMKKYTRILLMLFMLSLTSAKIYGKVSIVPLPVSVVEHPGEFRLHRDLIIGYSDRSLYDAAVYLRGILSSPTGYTIRLKKGRGDISLVLRRPSGADDESYTLSVTGKRIIVKAGSYRGVIDGISSLRQLLPDEIESSGIARNVKWTIPDVEIADRPAYRWRGLMLDVARHFYTKKEVERFLDMMALYKFDKLHWHLTDSQGWRIEIKKYPLLTRNGAWRKPIDIDQNCMNRERTEKNPDFIIPSGRFKVVNGDSLYGGYYTQKDIREIVKYAAVRGIDVIPEIDMPGHSDAAIANYPYLSCFDNPHSGSSICPGKDSTMEFCKNVYKEIFSMFPYHYVHIGGDEVDKTNWKKCSYCQSRIKSEGLASEEELQSWFVHQMEHFFNAHGRRLIGWDEILEGGLSPTATVDWWRSEFGDVVKKTTDHGNEVILCPTSFCYFDYSQDNNTLKRLYLGNILPAGLSDSQKKLIKGMQANIWTEQIPSEKRLQFMVFPRALALAERAWTKSDLQSWDSFSGRLPEQLRRLDVMKVNYRTLNSEIK
ncbi:MAG: beta-N-acetylhexosaminidase [Prevotella sp.]|jgi:hexosaminidase|nr:beta-N-acetylhexosaminidase [Prevotella sp.]